MEAIIKEHILKFGETRKKGQYKDSTIKMYVSNIKNLQKLVEGDKPFDDLEWTENVENVQEKLNKIDNVQTRRNYVNSLIVSLQTMTYPKDLVSKYETLRDLLNSQYANSGYLTPNQENIMNKVSKEDILTFLKKEVKELAIVPSHSPEHKRFTLFTILSIHTKYPFRNELGDMKVIRHALFDKLPEEDKLANNWYVLDKGWNEARFVLTKYKTKNVYGIKEFDVIPPFKAYILKSFQNRQISLKDANHQPLFVLNSGARWANEDQPLTRNKVSKYLGEYTKEHLGHNISTTLMTKYFGCSPKDPLNPTLEELEQIKSECDMRGHSVATKFSHYSG
jgi:hypothetical protein